MASQSFQEQHVVAQDDEAVEVVHLEPQDVAVNARDQEPQEQQVVAPYIDGIMDMKLEQRDVAPGAQKQNEHLEPREVAPNLPKKQMGQHDVASNDTPTSEVQGAAPASQQTVSNGLRRSDRTTRRPKYMEDYVTFADSD